MAHYLSYLGIPFPVVSIAAPALTQNPTEMTAQLACCLSKATTFAATRAALRNVSQKKVSAGR